MKTNSQAGVSLVELMIAMTLGIFLMGATAQMYFSTRLTSNLNNELNRLQENGRFALELLSESIRIAGYMGPSQTGAIPAYFLQSACGGFDPCTSDGGGTNSDRIAVQINPPPDDGTETDCTGTAIGATDVIANVYYITTTDDVSTLTCRGFNVTTNAWNAAEQALIDGIDSMQIQYGIDSTGNGTTAFVSADQVASWGDVRAVRIGLLINAGDSSDAVGDTEREFILLDADKMTFNDEKVRQIYTTTAAINND
jgi:type IV pilus assembly protein PilW